MSAVVLVADARPGFGLVIRDVELAVAARLAAWWVARGYVVTVERDDPLRTGLA